MNTTGSLRRAANRLVVGVCLALAIGALAGCSQNNSLPPEEARKSIGQVPPGGPPGPPPELRPRTIPMKGPAGK